MSESVLTTRLKQLSAVTKYKVTIAPSNLILLNQLCDQLFYVIIRILNIWSHNLKNSQFKSFYPKITFDYTKYNVYLKITQQTYFQVINNKKLNIWKTQKNYVKKIILGKQK